MYTFQPLEVYKAFPKNPEDLVSSGLSLLTVKQGGLCTFIHVCE